MMLRCPPVSSRCSRPRGWPRTRAYRRRRSTTSAVPEADRGAFEAVASFAIGSPRCRPGSSSSRPTRLQTGREASQPGGATDERRPQPTRDRRVRPDHHHQDGGRQLPRGGSAPRLDGRIRTVTASGTSRSSAQAALRVELSRRPAHAGLSDGLQADSSFEALRRTWLADVQIRPDLSDGTRNRYERSLRSLDLPTFGKLRLREISTARIDQFLKQQALRSYARAKHARVVLNLMFDFALRLDAITCNPVIGCSRMRKPPSTLRALTRADRRGARGAGGLAQRPGGPWAEAGRPRAGPPRGAARRGPARCEPSSGTYATSDNRTLNLEIERAQPIADGNRHTTNRSIARCPLAPTTCRCTRSRRGVRGRTLRLRIAQRRASVLQTDVRDRARWGRCSCSA